MVTHVSGRQTQFSYFDQLLEGPVWKGGKTLDFGGNIGGFLAGAGNHVDHDDYWCLDLTRGAIEQGRRKFPRAHFVHYNRYSSYFNPDGIRHLPIPDLGVKFDIILAFSVFTHTHRSEMLELVGQLRGMLAPSGVFAFTFCEPGYDRSLSAPELPSGTDVRKMLEWEQAKNPSLEIESRVERARQSKWCLLIDDEPYVEPGDEALPARAVGPSRGVLLHVLYGGAHGVALPGRDHAPAGQPRMAALLHHQKRMGLTHAPD